MKKKIVVIGSGSISKKHKKILKKIDKKVLIVSLGSREFSQNSKEKIEKLKKFNPENFIICSPSSLHLHHLMLIEKYFSKKNVLIEKPLFNKTVKIKNKFKNKYVVGYNLRYHPVLKFIKSFIKKKKIFYIKIESSSYLPSWRKINYKNSVSAKKKLGGGVLLEMSHEIDFLTWIFGKLKLSNVLNDKASDLKINTDDFLIINGKTKNNSVVSMNMNFFSHLMRRELIVVGKNFSLSGDLIKNEVILVKNFKKKRIKFKNFKLDHTYKYQLQDFLSKKYKYTCSLKEGVKILDLIETIQKMKK